jgi:PAS domain-containing protein
MPEMTTDDEAPDDAREGVFTIDQAGRIILCNDICLRLLGYGSADEIVGSHAIIFLPARGQNAGEASVSQHPLLVCARGEAGPVQGVGTFVRADDISIAVRYRALPVWLDWSRRGAVCVFSLSE